MSSGMEVHGLGLRASAALRFEERRGSGELTSCRIRDKDRGGLQNTVEKEGLKLGIKKHSRCCCLCGDHWWECATRRPEDQGRTPPWLWPSVTDLWACPLEERSSTWGLSACGWTEGGESTPSPQAGTPLSHNVHVGVSLQGAVKATFHGTVPEVTPWSDLLPVLCYESPLCSACSGASLTEQHTPAPAVGVPQLTPLDPMSMMAWQP